MLASPATMRTIFAIMLLVGGMLALAYLGFTHSEQTFEATVGPLDAMVALGFVGGGLLVGRKK
jgi:hypothetical protein